MSENAKVLYTATVDTVGARDGASGGADGRLDVKLALVRRLRHSVTDLAATSITFLALFAALTILQLHLPSL